VRASSDRGSASFHIFYVEVWLDVLQQLSEAMTLSVVRAS
jgi:hypothetical protein